MKRNMSAGEPSKAVMKECWNRAPSVASDRRLDTGFRMNRFLFVSSRGMANLKMSESKNLCTKRVGLIDAATLPLVY